MSKQIHLNGLRGSGVYTLVDAEDYEYLNQWSWYLTKKGYVSRTDYSNGRPGKTIRMHRFIMNTPRGMETDHKNRDKLDNRKENLRICTTTQNQANIPVRRRNILGVKGVCRQQGKYRASISVSGKPIHLGHFDTLLEASNAYDDAANIYFGEFASLNNLA